LLQSFEEVQTALAEFKSKYSLSKVGAQGFCWGGKYTVLALGRVSEHAYPCCLLSQTRASAFLRELSCIAQSRKAPLAVHRACILVVAAQRTGALRKGCLTLVL
jgi:dienelactone hydrolase